MTTSNRCPAFAEGYANDTEFSGNAFYSLHPTPKSINVRAYVDSVSFLFEYNVSLPNLPTEPLCLPLHQDTSLIGNWLFISPDTAYALLSLYFDFADLSLPLYHRVEPTATDYVQIDSVKQTTLDATSYVDVDGVVKALHVPDRSED